MDNDIEAYQLAVEKDKLIQEFANKIACTDCGEAISSALKASAQKENAQKEIPPHLSMTLNGEGTTQLVHPDGTTADVFSGTGDHVNNP